MAGPALPRVHRPPLLTLLAVIAISSLDRETGCWSFWDDCFDVIDIIQEWREDWG